MGDEVAAKNGYHLQPVSEMHLHSTRDYGILSTRFGRPLGDIFVLQLGGAVVLFVVLMAAVNFVNIYTAPRMQECEKSGSAKFWVLEGIT
jgi:hypothetical protein